MKALHDKVVALHSMVQRHRRQLVKAKSYAAAAKLQRVQRERDKEIAKLRSSFRLIEGGC